MRSPTPRATATKRRRTAIATPSFRRLKTWRTSSASLRILEQEAEVEQRAVDSAQHSFDLSNARYKGGVTSYLEVLTAEQTLLQDQVTAINIESRQFAASVSLVRALGGGWDRTQLP